MESRQTISPSSTQVMCLEGLAHGCSGSMASTSWQLRPQLFIWIKSFSFCAESDLRVWLRLGKGMHHSSFSDGPKLAEHALLLSPGPEPEDVVGYTDRRLKPPKFLSPMDWRQRL